MNLNFTRTLACLAALLLGFSSLRSHAQEEKMPEPQKEHEWLKQFVGEWNVEVEIFMEPGKEPMKSKGTETGRMIGGFWTVVEAKGEALGMPFTSLLTIGYDVDKKKYIGTWVDSMQHLMWSYTGAVDATGKILTLDTEGPCPMKGGKICKFKDVTEFKSKDHRVFTSSIQDDDGKWVTMLTVTAKRTK